MYKKSFLLFLFILALAFGAVAQTPGSWRVIPMSGLTFDRVVDTPQLVYYTTGNALYSYDKENNETVYYAPGTRVSDSNVKTIRYNPKGKYLLCVYDNYNIDLIYDDGRIVNFPELKEAKINGDKTINDINFGDGRIYIATAFGIVVYDEQRHVVIESGIYNRNVEKIAEFGDNLFIYFDSEMKYSPKSDRHNTLDKFKTLWKTYMQSWLPVSDNSFIVIDNNQIMVAKFDIVTKSLNHTYVADINQKSTTIDVYKDGYFCVDKSGKFVILDKDGYLVESTEVPELLKDHQIGMWSSLKSVWAANDEGIGNYDISGGTVTVLSDKFVPMSSKQFNNAYSCNTPDGSKVYFNGIGNSTYHPSGDTGSGLDSPLLMESYDWATGEITPNYPVMEKQLSDISQAAQDYNGGKHLMYGGMGQTVVDQVDPSFIYHANNIDGLVVLKDGEVFYNYGAHNSPVVSFWGARTYGLKFDNQGNLWITLWANLDHDGTSPLRVLSKESLALMRQNPKSLEEKVGDKYKHWLIPKWVDRNSGYNDGKITFSGNYALYIDGEYDGSMVGIDTKGTLDVSDDKLARFTNILDQDGNVNQLIAKSAVITDKKGDIWIGADNGVFIVKDLKKLVDDSSNYLSAIRPKVPRNDGTIYADYLLSTDQIIDIAVDPTNRKWLATQRSGLYLVNEDGTEIIEEWNKDNSPLISNTITMVVCDPNGNDVLIGTPEGLFVYSSNASPAAESYDEVIAYPNPVRPDYTGWITIKGLMDNSLVKIADVKGNVVWTGRSEGGLAVWDGCDAAGNRVHSGVYMVYTSQNASGSSSGAVTKIVVIN